MTDLPERLRIKASMIELGERIAWGSDSSLMREAADALEMAAPDVQGEPVGEVRFEFGAPSSIFAELYSKSLPALAPGTKLYTAPQPAEQQPAPDVDVLVEALESLIKGYVSLLEAGMDRITSLGGDCDPVPVMEQNDPWLRDARAALAAHRKQGGEK